MECKEESPVTLTSKSSMVEEVILSEENLTMEVEVDDKAEMLSFDAINATSWGISHECPRKEDVGQRGAYVAQNEQQQEQSAVVEVLPETRESLMMNKVLLKPEKKQAEPAQRKCLFKTVCKVQGKC